MNEDNPTMDNNEIIFELPSHLPVWQVQETHPHLVMSLYNTLKDVYDPEIRLSVIDLGLIRDIQIGESEAIITMILTTPFCPYGPLLMESVREKVEGIIKKPTKIVLGTEFWTPSMMPEDLRPDWGIY